MNLQQQRRIEPDTPLLLSSDHTLTGNRFAATLTKTTVCRILMITLETKTFRRLRYRPATLRTELAVRRILMMAVDTEALRKHRHGMTAVHTVFTVCRILMSAVRTDHLRRLHRLRLFGLGLLFLFFSLADDTAQPHQPQSGSNHTDRLEKIDFFSDQSANAHGNAGRTKHTESGCQNGVLVNNETHVHSPYFTVIRFMPVTSTPATSSADTINSAET